MYPVIGTNMSVHRSSSAVDEVLKKTDEYWTEFCTMVILGSTLFRVESQLT